MLTENVVIFGGTGGGKTSGSGSAIAHALLGPANAGMLVCTSKADEVELWRRYCAEAGRSEELRVIEPGGRWRFNPVSYEMTRRSGVGTAENVVGLIEAMLECADRQGAGSGREDESYWRRATKQLVRNFVDLLILATGTVTIEALYRAVISAPQSLEDVRSESWRKSSFLFQLLTDADSRVSTASQRRDLALVADYLLVDLAALSPKTKSTVVSCLTSQIDPLQRGVLRDLFGADSTVTPDDCANGAVIVIGLPIQTYRETGVLANVLAKYCWQRSMEGRPIGPESRGVFLWCDEFQNIVTSRDAQFLAGCRSSRAGAVLLTQNCPGVHAALGGGDKGRAEADQIFGNCSLKIFHANSDPASNEWASTLLGRSKQLLANGNTSYAPDDVSFGGHGMSLFGPQATTTAGFSESYEFDVQPSEFTRLRTGGPANAWNVDAIVFQNGRIFKHTGRNHLRVTFKQRR